MNEIREAGQFTMITIQKHLLTIFLGFVCYNICVLQTQLKQSQKNQALKELN